VYDLPSAVDAASRLHVEIGKSCCGSPRPRRASAGFRATGLHLTDGTGDRVINRNENRPSSWWTRTPPKTSAHADQRCRRMNVHVRLLTAELCRSPWGLRGGGANRHFHWGTCSAIFRARSTAAELAWSAESLSTATCTVFDRSPAGNSTAPPPMKRMPLGRGVVGSGSAGAGCHCAPFRDC
jgi:hypothetical protein